MDNNTRLIDRDIYEQVKKEISSRESVVGIDALHTHAIIINRLLAIESKLDALEKRLRQTSVH